MVWANVVTVEVVWQVEVTSESVAGDAKGLEGPRYENHLILIATTPKF